MNKSLRLGLWPARGGGQPAAPSGLTAPAGVQFVPGEDVLLLAVTLPKMSAAQRRVTVAFAVEDQIARPLDEVHVVLGPELPDKRWLVGVMARAAMAAAVRPGIRLVPDTLALPIPPPGTWSVHEDRGRAVIRLPDGTGLVSGPQDFAVLHQIAGSPAITLYGGQIAIAHARASLPPLTLPASFDLTDRHSGTRRLPPLAKRLLVIAAVAAVGHLAILLADIYSLSRRQSTLAAEIRLAAGVGADVPVDVLLTRILASAPSAPEAGFLDLLSAAFVAAAPQAGQVSVQDLHYQAAGNRLTLGLQAADLGTLQQLETSLTTAGLAVEAGPATSANGTAEQQLTLQGPPT